MGGLGGTSGGVIVAAYRWGVWVSWLGRRGYRGRVLGGLGVLGWVEAREGWGEVKFAWGGRLGAPGHELVGLIGRVFLAFFFVSLAAQFRLYLALQAANGRETAWCEVRELRLQTPHQEDLGASFVPRTPRHCLRASPSTVASMPGPARGA